MPEIVGVPEGLRECVWVRDGLCVMLGVFDWLAEPVVLLVRVSVGDFVTVGVPVSEIEPVTDWDAVDVALGVSDVLGVQVADEERV